jgi:hypothetical protein
MRRVITHALIIAVLLGLVAAGISCTEAPKGSVLGYRIEDDKSATVTNWWEVGGRIAYVTIQNIGGDGSVTVYAKFESSKVQKTIVYLKKGETREVAFHYMASTYTPVFWAD